MEDGMDKLIDVKECITKLYTMFDADELSHCGYVDTLQALRILDSLTNLVNRSVTKGFNDSMIDEVKHKEEYKKYLKMSDFIE